MLFLYLPILNESEVFSSALATFTSMYSFNGRDLGTDPTKCPAEGFQWRGSGTPKSGRGSWYNPKTDESLHPDFNHKGDMKPHWDYEGPNGEEARVFTDGTWVWK